jgi:hypothetical protein
VTCKIRSSASKEWSGTFEELGRKREKILQRLKVMMDSHAREDGREGRKGEAQKRFAAGVARQERAVRRIEAFLEANKPKPGKQRKELQSNVTDNESAKLHSSHGMIQGYNGLAMVDGKRQIIVAAEPVGSVDEGEHLAEVLEQAEANAAAAGMGEKALEGTTLLVDTSYYSEGNIKLCDERRMDAYIPDSQFRSRDPRFPRTNRRREHKGLYGQDRFRFDGQRKVYVCPNGKELKLNAKGCRVGGFEGRRYEARKLDCQECPLRAQCLKKGAGRRKLYIVERRVGRDWLGEMRKKIDSVEGRAAYARRMGIVEPVFGNITGAKRLDRFTLRGRPKVRVQWQLYAVVHNIEKIAHYGKRAGPPGKTGRKTAARR